ncbi:PepSY domain-containing protein [Psychromonas sp. B3M02]|uniref:PepSY-associated TM helix domain-containing protein n=1 Tax=Psychromonas sp. B3M02 TaxID=2267226 RepID=UPI000DE8515D|nr:PepSY domain-containing protein [Psychromonas sp. B3M02]RBW46342.1 PepSY domain-containing protein [Psychromonas sp. B3M02]
MSNSKSFYMSVWRWHFYAGLYTIPFLMMLAVTGLLMLYSPVVEKWTNQDLYQVEQVTQSPISYTAQKKLVAQAYPEDLIKSIHSSRAPADSTRFQVMHNGDALTVFVDPYQAKVLGDLSISDSLYAWADNTHGTFMLGDSGDKMIEIAVSFTILLVITGLYLWWPRSGKTLKAALCVTANKGREYWRDLHSVIGAWVSVILVFFCLSGLAWASVWGGSMLQLWSTFPMQKSASSVSSTLTHDSLNVPGLKQVPWGLEQSALPESIASRNTETVSLDQIIEQSQTLGFTQFQVFFPKGDTGVYTTSASSMSKDIENATDDRTVHFDQYSGEVLADVGYADYSLAAKSMAIGISLHMGQWGLWNYVVNTLFCLGILLICITGVVIWWLRRPQGKIALAAPPKPKDLTLWKQATWLLLPISLLFPLGAAAIFSVLIIDRIALFIAPKARAIFK